MFNRGTSAIKSDVAAGGLKRDASRRKVFPGWRRGEFGISEVASAIFILPFMAFLIFALIETGINMHYRTMVDNITQTTVRQISQDGALYWARTSVFPAEYTTPPANGWATVGQASLQNLCGAGNARCRTAPSMVCNVAGSTSITGFAIQLAPTVNSRVTCTATFSYRPVSPLSTNPATSVGFSGFLTRDMVITIQGSTTVGQTG